MQTPYEVKGVILVDFEYDVSRQHAGRVRAFCLPEVAVWAAHLIIAEFFGQCAAGSRLLAPAGRREETSKVARPRGSVGAECGAEDSQRQWSH